jgi:site-specific DNA-methyltransferase (cytosine-N4-specific)
MVTRQRLLAADSRDLSELPPESVHLVVTSPPYPMIAMWDGLFSTLDPRVGEALERGDGPGAFAAMHAQLDGVWGEVHRLLCPGGIACLNLGDATRSIGGSFQLYSNHTRVLYSCLALGFQALPEIVWRKPTNAPTKFLGSGTLPPGAYVTLEHEWVLVLRKGGPRRFASAEDKQRRRHSAYFWEERNRWFSDLWELTGSRQELPAAGRQRQRSAAFPLELACRLVQMFSLQEDTVLDPFLGSGTTLFAAALSGRNGIGVEIEPGLLPAAGQGLGRLPALAGERLAARLAAHRQLVEERRRRGLPVEHRSLRYGIPVVSRQEREMRLPLLTGVRAVPGAPGQWEVSYTEPSAAGEVEAGSLHASPDGQQELFSVSRTRGSSSAHGGESSGP